MSRPVRPILQTIYRRLFRAFGPQHWWPGETPFEVIVGAVLTQNTNWGNVEKAIRNLKAAGVLEPVKLHRLSHHDLAALIRPAGYFNVKARRLKALLDVIVGTYRGDLKAMGRVPLPELRRELLAVNGVGPETADSILLYAFGKPVFVVDAYTKRFLRRHNLIGEDADYHAIQRLFTEHLPPDVRHFNEYHALIVHLGKDFCKPRARCGECPLNDVQYDLHSRCGRCYRSLCAGEKRYRVQDDEQTVFCCAECWRR